MRCEMTDETRSPRVADGGRPNIAYRTREGLPRQWARSQRSLLPCSAQATRSKARCEKIIEDGARPTGCRDEPRNKVPFVRSPPMRSLRHVAHAKCDHYFSSFVFRTHGSVELDVCFLPVAADR